MIDMLSERNLEQEERKAQDPLEGEKEDMVGDNQRAKKIMEKGIITQYPDFMNLSRSLKIQVLNLRFFPLIAIIDSERIPERSSLDSLSVPLGAGVKLVNTQADLWRAKVLGRWKRW